jgi:nitrogen fixation protein FixH
MLDFERREGAVTASPNTEEPIMNTNRLRPWTLAAGLAVVIAANGAFAYFTQGLSLASHGRALDATAEENARGWTGNLHFLDRGDQSGKIVFDLADRAGKPLTDLAVKARAVRVDGPGADVLVVMHENSPGRYVGHAELDRAGQWEIQASARHAADHLDLSRQITVN